MTLKIFSHQLILGVFGECSWANPIDYQHQSLQYLHRYVAIKNELPQGAPTSPIISNMICAKLDSQLQDLAWQHKCFYTRYADDITFSTTLLEFPSEIASVSPVFSVTLGNELKRIIKENGFDVNQKKTRAFPHHKRQEVTGLTVNKTPNVRRKYIMQIRAMLHDWENTDLESAQIKYAAFESNQKYRNPESEIPSFKQVVRGKINFLKMVKGSNNHVYKRFRDKLKFLNRQDKNIPLANIPSAMERQIIIYTEGITDKLILQTAWKKLHPNEEEYPYKIKEVEIEKGVGGGATGVTAELSRHRKQRGIIIGIYDNDSGGVTEFNKLRQAFVKKDGCKILFEENAAAFLLPIPSGKENLASLKLLWIENYFSVSALNSKAVDGYGLIFQVKSDAHGAQITEKSTISEGELEFVAKEVGKQVFAEKIVPTLPPEEFEGFRLVFEKIKFILEQLQ